MILKGNSRKGGSYLVSHMLNETDNDHVEVHELKGFASTDFATAVYEVDALTKGTNCQKNFFSLSINPPADAHVSEQDYIDAIRQSENALNLTDQPRAIIFHEKEGRRHCHVIWSRIDAENMKAIPDSFSKLKLREVSRDLYRQHGWEMPSGLEDKGRASPTSSRGDQAIEKRSELTLEDHQSLIREAWDKSDDGQSFTAALDERGYILAHGKRGHVAVDIETGDPHSIARRLQLKKKAIEAKLGPPSGLPSIEAAKKQAQQRQQARIDRADDAQKKEGRYEKQLQALKIQQRKERNTLLHQQQFERDRQEQSFVAELRRRLKHVIDRSKAEILRLRDKWLGKDNDAEHAARIVNLRKTQAQQFAEQRDALRKEHLRQRQDLQRGLLAERYVNKSAALAKRQAPSSEQDQAAKRAEILAKLNKDRRNDRRFER